MNKFWVLDKPDDAEGNSREADWVQSELRYESIRCPIDPSGHRRAGKRISKLSVTLPNLEPLDFVWACWECLVQERVVQLFREIGLKGFEVLPATARFSRSSRQAPKFWELVATGSAGLISPKSGYSILHRCPACGAIDDDTKIDDPTKVVDESSWDGSDFFRVERISGWIFITDRVVQVLRESQFKGWKAYSLAEMKESFDIAVPDREDHP
jgi:hypothetical protein